MDPTNTEDASGTEENQLLVKYDTSLGGIDSDDAEGGLGGKDRDDKKVTKSTAAGSTSPKTEPTTTKSNSDIDDKSILDLVGKKIDPVKKIEKKLGDKFEDARDSLVESLFEQSNVKRAERLASAEAEPVTKKVTGMLNRLINASGKAPGSADSFVEGSAKKIISHLEKPSSATRELLESGGDIARAIAGGTKNSKNLRLAGAATLFAAAGYGIGKVKEHGKDMRKREQRVDPDQEQRLRQSLLDDG